MPNGDGPEAALRLLVECADDDRRIYEMAEVHKSRIKSRAEDELLLWDAIQGYTLAARYESDEKIEAIAHSIGRSKAFVHSIAMKYGATPRNSKGEKVAVPFEETPGVSALERIRQARADLVRELHAMQQDEEAQQIDAGVEKTLRRWTRRKGVTGGGALVAGGAVLGGGMSAASAAVTTTAAAAAGMSMTQLITAGVIAGGLVVGGGHVVTEVVDKATTPSHATAPIISPTRGVEQPIPSPSAEIPAEDAVLAGPSASAIPSPSGNPSPEPIRTITISPTQSPTVTVTPVPVSTRRRRHPDTTPVLITMAPSSAPIETTSPVPVPATSLPAPSPESTTPSPEPSRSPGDIRSGIGAALQCLTSGPCQ